MDEQNFNKQYQFVDVLPAFLNTAAAPSSPIFMSHAGYEHFRSMDEVVHDVTKRETWRSDLAPNDLKVFCAQIGFRKRLHALSEEANQPENEQEVAA